MHQSVENMVLKKISPSSTDIKNAELFKNHLMDIIKSTGMNAVVCGSLGKNTWLKGDYDIDVFILFNKNVPREELETKGIRIGKRVAKKMNAKPVIKYAEHPYTRFRKNGFDVDVVPCYKIKSGEHIKSAVDRSPLHVEYVNAQLKNAQCNEVRLLKQFMKGIGVYGSDAKNLGFSGYVCELLIIHYGSFRNVLKAAKKWIPGETIGKGKKFKSPLIVIDPVDKNRNAAAVISAENLFRFKYKSACYLKKPSMDYFYEKKPELTKTEEKIISKRGTKIICIKFKKPDEIDDIIFPQIRRLKRRLIQILDEFNVIRAVDYSDNHIFILIELEIHKLPLIEKMKGPPIYSRESENFIRKYRKNHLFLEDIYWCAEKRRTFITPEQQITHFIKHFRKEDGVPNKLVKNFRKAKLVDWKQKALKKALKKAYFDRII